MVLFYALHFFAGHCKHFQNSCKSIFYHPHTNCYEQELLHLENHFVDVSILFFYVNCNISQAYLESLKTQKNQTFLRVFFKINFVFFLQYFNSCFILDYCENVRKKINSHTVLLKIKKGGEKEI